MARLDLDWLGVFVETYQTQSVSRGRAAGHRAGHGQHGAGAQHDVALVALPGEPLIVWLRRTMAGLFGARD